MKNTEAVRVGVIGAGANTKLRHIPGFQAIAGVTVDVVANRSLESSRAVADAFGIPRVAENWQAVVADDSIDAICIGTWPYKHAEIAKAGLRAGKHVLTEARMAMNALEAQAMLEVSRAHPDRVAQIVPSPFTLKWDATIAALLSSGELGELREISVVKTLPVNVDTDAPLTWRQNIEYSGSNALMLGIYYEAVQRWLQEEPLRVWAHGRIFTESRFDLEKNEPHAVRIPETLTFMAEYKDGLQLTGLMSGMELGSGRDEIAICGALGTLRLDLKNGALFRTLLGGEEEVVDPKPEDMADWNVEADFIASIREDKPVTLTGFEDGVNYMKFTDGVKASFDAGGQWMELA